jgi:transcriptional regulator with GAF, ATPase, and Fis domain
MLAVATTMSRLSLLVDLAAALAREVDLDGLLGEVCERMARAFDAERATVWLFDAERGDLVARVALLPELAELRQPLDRGIAGHVARNGQIVRVSSVEEDPRFDRSVDEATGFRTRSMLAAPVLDQVGGPVRGVVQILNKAGAAFDEEDERYLVALANQLGRALSMTTLRPSDASGPGLNLRGPLNRIVGQSAVMQAVYRKVLLAAGSDATVLIRGETGTGKGLIARAVHANSPRQSGPLVTIDCTTLPKELVESELFGHERGAFTGADRRVVGKVELAERGTLFLDEIGDLGPDVQSKLLRFLQERQFERVGGRETLSADVRIVAATHRDLAAAVDVGGFREDLYYRLRVVTVDVPPLRDRGGAEIEALARHFAEGFARRYGRPAPTFDPTAIAALREHDFPGNVRELEAWMESAVVTSLDGILRGESLPSSRRGASLAGAGAGAGIRVAGTLDEAMRAYAQAVLEECGGNKTIAAKRLGIGRNRLARLLVP